MNHIKLNTIYLFMLLGSLGMPARCFAQTKPDTASGQLVWQVKYNIAAMGRGDYEFSIERQHKLHNAFELSLGPTFKNGIFEGNQNRLFNSYYTETAARENRLGYSLKLAYKYFFSSTASSGFYLSPQLAHTRYNYRFPLVNIDAASNGYQAENIVFNEMRLLFGYQIYTYNDKISIDLNLGTGIKQRNISFIEEQSYYDGSGNYISRFGTHTTTRFVSGIYTGVKIGWNIYEKKK